MHVLRKLECISKLPDLALRQLIEQRIQEISEFCTWDADVLGPFIVIEPGDTAQDLATEIGFSILINSFDGSTFGEDEFAPSFEWANAHSERLFEFVFVTNDDGFGYDIFIPNEPGIDSNLLAFCQQYAIPAP
jgi:hypothetical protein